MAVVGSAYSMFMILKQSIQSIYGLDLHTVHDTLKFSQTTPLLEQGAHGTVISSGILG